MGEVAETIGDIAGAIGRGLVAGLAGTAAMTVAQTIEMKIQEREPSDTPAEGLAKALPVEVPEDTKEKQKLSQLAHFAYGTTWGVPLALMRESGIPGLTATAGHFGAVWSAAMIMLPKMDLAPPVSEWDLKTLLTDGLHHAIYAAATGLTYHCITRNNRE